METADKKEASGEAACRKEAGYRGTLPSAQVRAQSRRVSGLDRNCESCENALRRAFWVTSSASASLRTMDKAFWSKHGPMGSHEVRECLEISREASLDLFNL
jgi:hypothetical protein